MWYGHPAQGRNNTLFHDMYCIAIHCFMICIVSWYTVSWYVLYRDTLFHYMYCIAIHCFIICIVSRYTISWYVLYRDTLFHDMYCIVIHYFICIVAQYTISWYILYRGTLFHDVWRPRKTSRKSLGVFACKRVVKVFLGHSVHFEILLRCFCYHTYLYVHQVFSWIHNRKLHFLGIL